MSFIRFGSVRVPMGSYTSKIRGAGASVIPDHLEPLLQSAEARSHYRWLAQKQLLSQDAILLGEGGPMSRLIVEKYAELTNRKVEYVSVSADTTEADLKQRREVRQQANGDKGVVFEDGPVVRAALQGSLLLIEGIERAERGVMPLLNNLLESREMALEDGRMILHHKRYDELLSTGETEQQLLRCAPEFQVVALGHVGCALDPPLRSRLQGRHIQHPKSAEFLHNERLKSLWMSLSAYHAADPSGRVIPDAISTFVYANQMLSASPDAALVDDVLTRYASEESHQSLARALQHVKTPDSDSPTSAAAATDVEAIAPDYVMTESSRKILAAARQDLDAGKSVLIQGRRGSGRRTLAMQLARQIEPVQLHRGMSTRELFVRRATLSNGDTIWQDTPLTIAARTGSTALLDSVENIEEQMHSLDRLFTQRILTDAHSEGTESLAHDGFRVVATSERTLRSNTLFSVHRLELTADETQYILRQNFPNLSQKLLSSVAHLVSHDGLALRQLIRALRVHTRGGLPLRDALELETLVEFMPNSQRQLTRATWEKAGIPKESGSGAPTLNERHSQENWSDTGGAKNEDNHLIPNVSDSFFQSDSQRKSLDLIAALFDSTTDPLLVLGVQGAGKNKMVDFFLQSRGLPRQYQQLHRDVTVSSLWQQQVITNEGSLAYVASPLVRAMQNGEVCMLDEVDKASPEIVATLRALGSGYCALPDGRVCCTQKTRAWVSPGVEVLPIHPNFRLVALANKSGWPFQGYNVHSELGDLFLPVPISNPSPHSLQAILQGAAPNVPSHFCKSLAFAFSDLLAAADAGRLSYPYSLREALSIVRHVNEFPEDSIEAALENTFAFDQLEPQVRSQVASSMRQHGISLDDSFERGVRAALAERELRVQVEEAQAARTGLPSSMPKHGRATDGKAHVGGNTWAGGTGGRDTAGLGGKHGPYRLDTGHGHQVHQVDEREKRWHSEEARLAARKMADDALRDKLRAVGLGEYEHSAYEEILARVRYNVQQLRRSLQLLHVAPKQERTWQRNQSDGDLDETRLVDGILGEANIYKRRGKPQSSQFGDRRKTRLRFLWDLSGSMYRFNSRDGRLTRQLEACLMVMEAFDGQTDFIVENFGHSGDSDYVELGWPTTTKERFAVLETMVAHSQYCWSGDNTLEATGRAIADLAEQEDDASLFVVSDANFRRYGIDAGQLAALLQRERSVRATCLFLASLGDEAAQLKRQLPPGAAHVCRSTAELPAIIAQELRSLVERKH